ncbi:hypothetical protein P3T40_004619 [Paraburkholderia sp. EB58]|jgi:hypothetical protein|uniref:hypothetical protein n=1 Tax=Paraburkholderia sp. EB58 TaxID=3035125 RepID=UPI003D1D43C7
MKANMEFKAYKDAPREMVPQEVREHAEIAAKRRLSLLSAALGMIGVLLFVFAEIFVKH